MSLCPYVLMFLLRRRPHALLPGRPVSRCPPPLPRTTVCRGGDGVARARHRGEHRDLQRRQHPAADAAAGARARTARLHLHQRLQRTAARRLVLSGRARFRRRRAGALGHRRVAHRGAQLLRSGRHRARLRRDRRAVLLRGARPARAARPRAQLARCRSGGARASFLDAAVQRRSRARRTPDRPERPGLHRRRDRWIPPIRACCASFPWTSLRRRTTSRG